MASQFTATGSEIIQVQGVSGNGQLSGVTETGTLVQITNFEGSMWMPTAQSATSNTTLAQINFSNNSAGTLSSFNLVAGGVYVYDIYLSVTCNASGGLKLAFGGTTTATSISSDTWAYNTTTVAQQTNVTTLTGNMLAYTGLVNTVNITGTILTATSGTFYLQFAQNASYATATTINPSSNFWVDRII